MCKISSISAHKILNSRGEWTLKATVYLTNGLGATASVPQGKSRGLNEAVCVSADQAVSNIRNILAPAIKDMDPTDQVKIDNRLIDKDGTENKAELGANAILAVSLAVAKAGALMKEKFLWEHLQNLAETNVGFPRLFINVINGGVHAGNGINVQEYVGITKKVAPTKSIEVSRLLYSQLKKYLAEEYGPSSTGLGDEGGFSPNINDDITPLEILKTVIAENNLSDDLNLGIDAAADNINKSKEDLFDFHSRIIADYGVKYIEDPFSEEKFGDFALLKQKFGDKVLICGDDLTVTNTFRMKKAADHDSVNSVIIKPNQIGTLTEVIKAIKFAKRKKWKVVVSHRSGETNDSFIADLAYAVNAYGIKLGSPA